MPITPINATTQTHKKSPYVKITGYGAVATGILSGIAAYNKKIRMHKHLAYITGLLTFAHIAIIKWLHNKKTS